MTSESQKTITLPIIGQTLCGDVEPETHEFVICPRPTKAKLKPYLKAYDLKRSGTVDQMLQALIDYASDRARWKGQFQAAQTRIRGSTSGTRANRTSAKRRRAAFGPGEGDGDGPAEYPSKKVALSLPDNRTSTDIESMRATARRVILAADARAQAQNKLKPKTASNTVTRGNTDAARSLSATPVVDDSEVLAPAMTQSPPGSPDFRIEQLRHRREFKQFRHSMELGMSSMQQLLLNLSSTAPGSHAVSLLTPGPPPSPPNVCAQAQDGNASPTVTTGDVSDLPASAPTVHLSSPRPTPPAATLNPAATTTASKCSQLFTLHLHDDDKPDQPATVITYTVSDLRQCLPPTTTYANDIPGLFRDWYKSDHIKLGSPKRGIPIRLWDTLFKGKKGLTDNRAWDSFRSQWHCWKYIVEKYEALGRSEDRFWSRYTAEDGARMGYQQILDALKVERKEERDQLAVHAEHARAFFGGDLQHPDAGKTFTYIKSGKTQVYSKPEQVGGRWLKLLEENEAIRSRWEAFQAMSGTDAC